jgi:hypothetical protein
MGKIRKTYDVKFKKHPSQKQLEDEQLKKKSRSAIKN